MPRRQYRHLTRLSAVSPAAAFLLSARCDISKHKEHFYFTSHMILMRTQYNSLCSLHYYNESGFFLVKGQHVTESVSLLLFGSEQTAGALCGFMKK